jgi:hypothetical protein
MLKNSRKRRWGGVAIVIALVAVVGGLFLGVEDEPEHDGKTISEWLEVYQKRRVEDGTIGPTGGPADAAIRAMGTNAMPYILAELRAEDSRLETLSLWLFRKQSLIRLRSQPADIRREAACGVLWETDDAVSGFGPQLIELLDSPDYLVQYSAASALVYCESVGIAEALARQLDKGKVWSQRGSAFALGRHTNAPAVAIPALTRALERSDAIVRLHSAGALEVYGARAYTAASALRRILENGKDINWKRFARTLHAVDPENAHKTLVPSLIERSSDSANRGGQFASISLLGAMGPRAKSALPELRALLLVDDVAVQKSAKTAIRAIRGEVSK